MNNKNKMKGGYDVWNKTWSKQAEKSLLNSLFTINSPSNIYQFWQRGYANDLLNLIRENKYTSFCELGAGKGTTSMYIAQNGYSNISMVDLAEEGFKIAKYSFKYYNLPEPRMILADVENTSLPGESYDCIYNIGLLEHFEDPSKTLKESYRLLKKGGIIFMPIIPKLPFSKSLIARILFNPISIVKFWAKKIIGNKPSDSHSSNILRTEYKKEYYRKVCTELGFKEIRCIPYNPYWKINRDGWFESNITLPIYNWHYNFFKARKKISLQTISAVEFCYLLIAYK